MAMSKLEIEMSMNIAKLQSDVQQANHTIQGFASSLKTAGATIAAAFSIDMVKDYVTGVISSLAALDDMSERTGASVESLSKLEAVMRVGGHSMETLEGGLIKLAKAIGSVDEKASPAKNALLNLGIDATKLKAEDTAEVYVKIAKTLNEYRDGIQKTAYLTELFGKSGAGQASIIKDLADAHEKLRVITADEAAEAEKLEKTWKSFNLVMGEAKKAMVIDMIPALTDIVTAMKEAYKQSGLLMSLWVGLGGVAANIFKQSDQAQLKELNQRIETAKGQLADAENIPYAALRDRKKEQFADALSKAIDERDTLLKRMNAPKLTEEPKKELPALVDFSKVGKEAKAIDDAMQKAREAYQKGLMDLVHRGIDEELKANKDAFEDKLISARQYFDTLEELTTTDFNLQRKMLEDRAKMEIDFAARQADEKDRIAAQSKVKDTMFALAKAEDEYQAKVRANHRERQAFAKEQITAWENVRAELATLEGREVDAARIRIDQQQAALRQSPDFDPESMDAQALDSVRQRTLLQAELNVLQRQSSEIMDALRLREEAIERSARAGAITQIESMQQIGEARKKAVTDLEDLTKAHETASVAGTEDMKLRSQRMREELERLKESADVMGNKIKSIFEDSFSNEFSKFITGTQNMKDAFKNFALSVIGELAKIQAKSLATSIFGGKDGILSGGGGLGGIFSGIGGFFSSLFKAEGGPVTGGRSYIVGERGPELFTPGMSGMITPNSALGGGGVTLVQNINIDARSDQATILAAMRAASQQAVRGINESLSRGGSFARSTGVA